MKIVDFKHDKDNEIIKFKVERDGEISALEVEWTGCCTSYTDINEFTEDWTDDEYEALDRFVSGCSDVLHYSRG